MNKEIFRSGNSVPPATAMNLAGGIAYEFTPKHALAQLVVTGTFQNTYYAQGEDQVQQILALCRQVPMEFVAKLAVYARQEGYMKDTPAFLVAFLVVNGYPNVDVVFNKVIDNAKMLRNFVQVMRSGVVGRKSLGSRAKRLVKQWFNSRNEVTLFRSSVGNDPSLADCIKLSHPTPGTPVREELFKYLLDKEYNFDKLPVLVQDFENFKKNKGQVPDVPFEMLTALPLATQEWTEIAKNATWTQTRMNLNTFQRHGVFDNPKMVKLVADRLRNKELIEKAKVFPYQLLSAFIASAGTIPKEITNALQDAMEISVNNVETFDGKVYILVDVSGSMSGSITGFRPGSTSKVRCIDVAGLFGSVFLRSNPNAEVIPFEHGVVKMTLNSRDSIMTNAQKLASVGGGGTNCSAPLHHLNSLGAKGDLVVYVSDNESWVDSSNRYNSGTQTMVEWKKFKKNNPGAKLVCIDLTPNKTTHATESNDILNVGGFSDSVFDVVTKFGKGLTGASFVATIESVTI